MGFYNKDRPATRILEAFQKEAKLRDSRTYPEWREKELFAVWRATNAERLALHKSPLSLEAVAQVDTYAAGHVDYATKLAYYCEELVYKDEVKVP